MDDFLDEISYSGTSLRHKVTNPDGCCQQKTCSFNVVPGGVLAIATHDNQPGTSAGFKLTAESDDPGWNFTVRPGSDNVRVFGIDGPNQHHGPMMRPADKQPPQGWQENEFDDSGAGWGPPDNGKVQFDCWYQVAGSP